MSKRTTTCDVCQRLVEAGHCLCVVCVQLNKWDDKTESLAADIRPETVARAIWAAAEEPPGQKRQPVAHVTMYFKLTAVQRAALTAWFHNRVAVFTDEPTGEVNLSGMLKEAAEVHEQMDPAERELLINQLLEEPLAQRGGK